MAKKIGKIFWFGGGILVLVFFIRFAWMKESMGQSFPVYITPLLLIVGAFVMVGFWIVGDYLFRE